MLSEVKRRSRHTQEQVNYVCIMMEGLFNTLGADILGTTTIMPLFMAELGASLSLIGSFSTVQAVISAVAPMLFGGFAAAATSKRRLSLTFNGIGRGAILIIPLLLVLGLQGQGMLAAFFAVMIIYYLCQPITGLSWNYLLGDCVEASQRGRLLGTLLGLSGILTFLSSNLIKLIRADTRLAPMSQYAVIFTLGGVMLVLSVLCFLPLREKTHAAAPKEERSPKAYMAALFACFKVKPYMRAIRTNIFSSLSLAVNAFFFIYAQNTLRLTADQISNLIICQTLGLMLGGFITGRVSSRFGIKRMLVMVECLGVCVPVLGLLSAGADAPFVLCACAVFLIGFSRSGTIGYQAYILEVMPTGQTIYAMAAKSMALLPFSLASVVIGSYLDVYPMRNVFIFQMAAALMAVVCATRLKLSVYAQKSDTSHQKQ